MRKHQRALKSTISTALSAALALPLWGYEQNASVPRPFIEEQRQQARECLLREQQERSVDARIPTGTALQTARLTPSEAPCSIVARLALEGELSTDFGWSLDAANGDRADDSPIGLCLGAQGIETVVSRVQRAIVDRGYVTTRVLAGRQDLSSGTLTLAPSTNHRRPHRPTSPPIRPHIPIHLPRPVVMIPHRVVATPGIAVPQRGPQILRTRRAAVITPVVTAIRIRIQTGARPIRSLLLIPLACLPLRFGQIARPGVDDGQPAVGLRLQRRRFSAPDRGNREHGRRTADRGAVGIHPLQLLGTPGVRRARLVRIADLACRIGASDDLCIRSRAEAGDSHGN